jgi:uncharacterized protein with WD repeat
MCDYGKKRRQGNEEACLTGRMFSREVNGIENSHSVEQGGKGAGGGCRTRSQSAFKENIPPMPQSPKQKRIKAKKEQEALKKKEEEKAQKEKQAKISQTNNLKEQQRLKEEREAHSLKEKLRLAEVLLTIAQEKQKKTSPKIESLEWI